MSIYDVVDEALGVKLTKQNFSGLDDLTPQRIDRILGAFNDLLRAITKPSPYSDLATISERLTEAELAQIRESEQNRILASPTFFAIPPTKAHQVRHFYPLDLGMSSTSKVGGTIESFEQTDAVEKNIRNLKRALLYPHSVVIPDALFFLAKQIDELEIMRKIFPAKEAQLSIQLTAFNLFLALSSYLKFLAEIRPLVENEIVILVPAPEIDLDAYLDHSANTFLPSPGFSIFDSPAWGEWARPRLPETLEGIIAPDALLALIFHTTRYNATLYFNNQLSISTYKLYLEYLSSTISAHKSEQSFSLGSVLLEGPQVELPGLEDLSLDDIVKVRSNEAMFAEWRLALERAVRELDKCQVSASAETKVFRQVVQDELIPIKLRIEQDVEKSSVLSKAGTATVSFALGALKGAVVGDWVSALTSGSITGAGGFLVDYLRSRKDIDTKKSFIALYNTMISEH